MFGDIMDFLVPNFSDDEHSRLNEEHRKALELDSRKELVDLEFLDQIRRKADYAFRVNRVKERIMILLICTFFVGGSYYFHTDHQWFGISLISISIIAPLLWFALILLTFGYERLSDPNAHIHVRDMIDTIESLYIEKLEKLAKLK